MIARSLSDDVDLADGMRFRDRDLPGRPSVLVVDVTATTIQVRIARTHAVSYSWLTRAEARRRLRGKRWEPET